MVRFLTWKYTDGSQISQQHHPMMDGDWKYGNNCKEVIFVMSNPNPLYTKEG